MSNAYKELIGFLVDGVDMDARTFVCTNLNAWKLPFSMCFPLVLVLVFRMLWAAVDEVMTNGIPEETFRPRRRLHDHGDCAQNVQSSNFGQSCVFSCL